MLNTVLDTADPKVNKEIIVRGRLGSDAEGRNMDKYDKCHLRCKW